MQGWTGRADASRENTGLTLMVAFNYGGRDELLDAFRALARRVQAGELAPDGISEADVSGALYTDGVPDPDLLIRTSGEMRDGRLEPEAISEKDVSRALYTADIPDPDLLIRTSGEMRLSNFLLWQIAYTELWITPTLWPDFGPVDLYRAVADFQGRSRRFGGV